MSGILIDILVYHDHKSVDLSNLGKNFKKLKVTTLRI
jgi:hypothetical protein